MPEITNVNATDKKVQVDQAYLESLTIKDMDLILDTLVNPITIADYIKNIDHEEVIEITDNMLYDDDITCALSILKSEIKKAKYQIKPYDDSSEAKKQVEIIEEALIPKLDKIIDSCFEGIIYGNILMAIRWDIENGLYKIKDINEIKPDLYNFTPDWKPYVIEDLNVGGEVLPYGAIIEIEDSPGKYKFVVHRHDTRMDNPYGLGIVIIAYYLWSMKNMDFQQWILFLKKIAIPSFIAVYEGTEDQQLMNARGTLLAAALKGIKSGSGGAMANVREIVTLSPQASAHAVFNTMADVVSKRIMKLITGSFLHSDTAKTGSYTTSTIHQETMRARVFSLVKEIELTINDKFIRSTIDLNTGQKPGEYATINFFFKDVASWDQIKDALTFGIPLKKDALVEDYNIPIIDEDEEEENIIVVNAPEQNPPDNPEKKEKEKETASLNPIEDFFFQRTLAQQKKEQSQQEIV